MSSPRDVNSYISLLHGLELLAGFNDLLFDLDYKHTSVPKVNPGKRVLQVL